MNILHLLRDHQTVMSQLEGMVTMIEAAAHRMHESLSHGGKIFFMGNGGSAADSQHLAAELIGRFMAERRALPAIALNTDTAILTALSNDYDYSLVFARQLEALCQPHDVVIGLSTSGNSKNVLKGMEAAKKIGAYTIGLTGQSGGKLVNLVDLCLRVPSTHTPRIQEAHMFIGHTLCEALEQMTLTENNSTRDVA